MDTSLFSEGDSLPTFQEGDILACFEEKSQIIDQFEKEVDVSYSHRLHSFLKNDHTARNSFMEFENHSNPLKGRGERGGPQENNEQLYSSFLPPEDQSGEQQLQNQRHNIQKETSLKRSVEKTSLAIPFSLQQQQQIQNIQRNFDKFDRPPLSQRLDTKSNQLQSTMQTNIKKSLNAQSQSSLTDRDGRDSFNPFGQGSSQLKTDRSTHSLRSSREGKLSAENIKNFYLDLQKSMHNTTNSNQKDKVSVDKENINPNIQCPFDSIKQIQINDIQIQKNQPPQIMTKNQQSSTSNLLKKERQNEFVKPQQQQQNQVKSSLERKGKQNTNLQNQNGYLFMEEEGEENCISLKQSAVSIKNSVSKGMEQQKSTQPQTKEKKKSEEQNEILAIVSKIRSIKSQIDDVNKIVNLKKKELDNFVKSARFLNSCEAVQKSKEEDLEVIKKLAASTAFLNTKYDEMNTNYNEYNDRREKYNYHSNHSDSTQDQYQENTNSFLSKCNNNTNTTNQQQQHYLSSNTTQINNSSLSQIQSNSKVALNQYYSVSHTNNHTSNTHPNKSNYNTNNTNQIEEKKKDHFLKPQSSSSRLHVINSSRNHYQSEQVLNQFDSESHISIQTSRENSQKQNSNKGYSTSRLMQKQEYENSSRERLKTQNNNLSDESNNQIQINQTLTQSSLYQTQSQNQFSRAKSYEQRSQQSKENSLVIESGQQQQQHQQMSSQAMIQNLISKLSLNKYTNKLNRLLQNHPSNQSSTCKDNTDQQPSKQTQQEIPTKQINTSSNKFGSQIPTAPSQSSLKIPTKGQQLMEQNNEHKQKQIRSYSYQEKYAIQKQLIQSSSIKV